MTPTHFAIIGGGWRAEFFLRVAHALPDRFRVAGMVVRNADKGKGIEERWGLPTYRTLDDLLNDCDIQFAVVCVAGGANAEVLTTVAERGVPALAETPPGMTLEELTALHELAEKGAKIQVAEQYIFQPLHAARLAIVASGKLGRVTQAQVSAAHGHHGAGLIRHFLGVTFEACSITAAKFTSPIVAGPGRDAILLGTIIVVGGRARAGVWAETRLLRSIPRPRGKIGPRGKKLKKRVKGFSLHVGIGGVQVERPPVSVQKTPAPPRVGRWAHLTPWGSLPECRGWAAEEWNPTDVTRDHG